MARVLTVHLDDAADERAVREEVGEVETEFGNLAAISAALPAAAEVSGPISKPLRVLARLSAPAAPRDGRATTGTARAKLALAELCGEVDGQVAALGVYARAHRKLGQPRPAELAAVLDGSRRSDA